MMILRLLKAFALIIFFIFLLYSSSALFAQTLHQGQWKTYTAMSSITDLAVVPSSGNIWAATTGGAFRFTPSDSPKVNIFALRNSDGLSDNTLTAIAADSNGKIYFGSLSGTLDVYTESTGKINSIPDIALTSYTRKQIYSIAIFGSRVYIATGFGLSIYDEVKSVFTETVTQFGTLTSQDTIFAVTEANDSIYIVQSRAIAIAAKNAPNLSDPRAWRIVFAGAGTTLNSITSVNGKIIIGGSEGIYNILGDSLQYIFTGDSISVKRLASSGNTLYVIDSRNGGRIKTSNDLQNFSTSQIPGNTSGQNVSSFALANVGGKIFGDSVGGGVILQPASGPAISQINPDGPLANFIVDLHYASSLGKLFVSLNNIGMSVFEPQKLSWSGYAVKDGILPRTSFLSSYYDTVHSKLWLSTFGGGLFSWTNADPLTLQHYGFSAGVSALAPPDTGFSVQGRGTLDNKGNFITTAFTFGGEGFMKTSDGKHFTAVQLNPPTNTISYGVTVEDMDDIYFVGTIDHTLPEPYGVFAVSPDGSITDIPGGNGSKLGSPSINALIVDQDNGLWCGTNVGVDVLTHYFQGNKPIFNTPRRLTFTDQQFVKAIAVDGVGNKWVGTDNGVFILSADGSDSLAHFTTANSPLIDNAVLSIAIDTKNGEAYIGTTKGISRVSSIYQEGATDYSKMYVYPNPVIQQSDDKIKVTITGLAGGSTVKIFSVSGRLVATIDGSALGSTVTWNGRDETGKLLTSGVYIAAAASPVSSLYGEAKFVLIRK